MLTHNLIITATALAFLSSVSTAYAAAVSAKDFVQKASVASEFEIESSKLALEKSQDKDIKNFAQKMIDDHTEAGKKLKDTLQSSKTSAKPQQELDTKHQNLISSLEAVSGDDFNKKYVDIQTKAHKEAVDLFSSYSKSGDDSALKEFAANTLPTLKEHLSHVQKLQAAQ